MVEEEEDVEGDDRLDEPEEDLHAEGCVCEGNHEVRQVADVLEVVGLREVVVAVDCREAEIELDVRLQGKGKRNSHWQFE